MKGCGSGGNQRIECAVSKICWNAWFPCFMSLGDSEAKNEIKKK